MTWAVRSSATLMHLVGGVSKSARLKRERGIIFATPAAAEHPATAVPFGVISEEVLPGHLARRGHLHNAQRARNSPPSNPQRRAAILSSSRPMFS